MVVALGAHEPFGLPDQVIWVGGVHAKIRLAMVVYRLRLVHDVLRGVRPLIFACIRPAVAGGLARVTVRRAQTASIRHLRRVTTGLLRCGENVCDMGLPGTIGE